VALHTNLIETTLNTPYLTFFFYEIIFSQDEPSIKVPKESSNLQRQLNA